MGQPSISRGARRAAGAVGVYALFYFLMVFAFVMNEGIEGDPGRLAPYWAVFGALYGLALGRWWVLPFPALHQFVVAPLWYSLKYVGSTNYTYDRATIVLAGTVGIASGLGLHALLRPWTRRSST